MPGAVERQKRHQQNIRLDLRRLRLRLADAPLPAIKRRVEAPRAHDKRLAAPGNDGQRQPRSLLRQRLHQRQRVDLALERHKAGDDDARRNGHWKRPHRNHLGGGLAFGHREGVAALGGFGTKPRFFSLDYINHLCRHRRPSLPSAQT